VQENSVPFLDDEIGRPAYSVDPGPSDPNFGLSPAEGSGAALYPQECRTTVPAPLGPSRLAGELHGFRSRAKALSCLRISLCGGFEAGCCSACHRRISRRRQKVTVSLVDATSAGTGEKGRLGSRCKSVPRRFHCGPCCVAGLDVDGAASPAALCGLLSGRLRVAAPSPTCADWCALARMQRHPDNPSRPEPPAKPEPCRERAARPARTRPPSVATYPATAVARAHS